MCYFSFFRLEYQQRRTSGSRNLSEKVEFPLRSHARELHRNSEVELCKSDLNYELRVARLSMNMIAFINFIDRFDYFRYQRNLNCMKSSAEEIRSCFNCTCLIQQLHLNGRSIYLS